MRDEQVAVPFNLTNPSTLMVFRVRNLVIWKILEKRAHA